MLTPCTVWPDSEETSLTCDAIDWVWFVGREDAEVLGCHYGALAWPFVGVRSPAEEGALSRMVRGRGTYADAAFLCAWLRDLDRISEAGHLLAVLSWASQ